MNIRSSYFRNFSHSIKLHISRSHRVLTCLFVWMYVCGFFFVKMCETTIWTHSSIVTRTIELLIFWGTREEMRWTWISWEFTLPNIFLVFSWCYFEISSCFLTGVQLITAGSALRKSVVINVLRFVMIWCDLPRCLGVFIVFRRMIYENQRIFSISVSNATRISSGVVRS